MKKQIAIILISVYPMYACNLDSNKNQVSNNTNSSSPPKNMVRKELENYCNNVYCLPISKQEIENPKLDKPFDVAVSSEGKKVFVTNMSKSKAIRSCNDNNPKEIIKGQYIYEITEDKQISVVKANGDYLYSCDLSDEIEIDSKNNVYFVKESVSKEKNVAKLVVSDEIYKMTPDKKIELIVKKVNTPDVSISALPQALELNNMKITNDGKDNIYFTLYGKAFYGSQEKLVMYDKNKNDFIEFLKNDNQDGAGSYLSEFLLNDNKLIYPDLTMTDIPYGSVKKVFTSENGEKLYPDAGKIQEVEPNRFIIITLFSKVFDNLGNIYGIYKHNNGAPENTIWKLTPNGELIKIAGISTAGYKDGKGEEALFNNPSNLSIDAQGNVYVADTGNNAIRKITPDGMVSTFYKND